MTPQHPTDDAAHPRSRSTAAFGPRTRLAGVGLCSVLLLAACGGGDEAENPTDVPEGEEVTITFMHAMASGALNEALVDATERFEAEHENITVELEALPDYGELNTQIEANVAAGDAPTIAQAYPSWAVPLMESEVIVPLDDYVEESEHYDSFYQGVQDDMVLEDGQNWMWPFNKSLYVMFYNPEMFPEEPETWDELAEMSAEVSDDEVVATSIDPGGIGSPGGGAFYADIVAQAAGGDLFDEEGNPTFTEPEVIEALEYLDDMREEGALTTGENYPGQVALGNGTGAYDISTVAGLSYQEEAVGDSFELGVAPLPEGEDGAANSLSGTNLVMFADADEAERAAAWQYMEFLSSPEEMARWSAETGYLPISEEAAEHEEFQPYAEEHPWVMDVVEQLETATAPVPQPWTQEAQGHFAAAVDEVLSGSATPEEALEQAQESAEQLID